MTIDPKINPYQSVSPLKAQPTYYRTAVAAATWSEILALATGPWSFLSGTLMKFGFPEPLHMAQSLLPPEPVNLCELSHSAQDALSASGTDLESLGYVSAQVARVDLLGDAEGARSLFRFPSGDRIGICLYTRCLYNEVSTITIASVIDGSKLLETSNSSFTLDDGIPSETERHPEQAAEWLHLRHDERLTTLKSVQRKNVSIDVFEDELSVIETMDALEQSSTRNFIKRGILKSLSPSQERRLRENDTQLTDDDL
ncbi:hypothetical protein SH528x_002971 [Novipirellula sp. SH528]|uniref:hypothetical protein n=1 Tax=Novipirellula sp. SH528 TaxID=3454466 RepID=UPI003FA07419